MHVYMYVCMYCMYSLCVPLNSCVESGGAVACCSTRSCEAQVNWHKTEPDQSGGQISALDHCDIPKGGQRTLE